MKKRLFIAASILALASNGALASDNRLEAALKKIADLEAKNKSLSEEVKSLRGEKPRREAKKGQSLTSSEPSLSQPKQYTLLDNNTPQNGSALVGFYAGVNGGYGGGDIDQYRNEFTVRTPPVNNMPFLDDVIANKRYTNRAGGALAGVQLGYNYVINKNILLGGEADIDWADISQKNYAAQAITYPGVSKGNTADSSNERVGLRWLGSARLRLGYSFDKFTPYLTGGLAFGGATSQTYFQSYSNFAVIGSIGSLGSNDHSTVSAGWLAGAGIEYALSNNISMKTEYLYSQIAAPSQNWYRLYTGGTALMSSGTSGQMGFHQVRFGINYHPHLFENPTITAKY